MGVVFFQNHLFSEVAFTGVEQCEVTLAFSVPGTQEQSLFHQNPLLLIQQFPEFSEVAHGRPTPALAENAGLDLPFIPAWM